VLLPPSYVTKLWEWLRPAIEASMPPLADRQADDAMGNVLERLLKGEFQCWIGIERVQGPVPVVYGLVVTGVFEEFGTRTKSLWIWALYGHRGVPAGLAAAGIDRLRAYAREHGYKWIAAVTSVGRVIEIVQQLGGDVSHSLIRIEV